MDLSEIVKEQLEQVKIFDACNSLTSFEIQRYYQNELRFNGVYSRNNLPRKTKTMRYN